MTLTERERMARETVLGILYAQEVESYVAYEKAGDREWHHVGLRDHVVPQPDLVAAWSKPEGRICYHHAHPDDRSLSPSDLRTLYNPGLEEVWAHCSSGIVHHAKLAPTAAIETFKTDHEHLNSVMSHEMACDFIKELLGTPLAGSTYRDLSDLAFCEALHQHGVIFFESVTAEGWVRPTQHDPAFPLLVALSRSILKRQWP